MIPITFSFHTYAAVFLTTDYLARLRRNRREAKWETEGRRAGSAEFAP